MMKSIVFALFWFALVGIGTAAPGEALAQTVEVAVNSGEGTCEGDDCAGDASGESLADAVDVDTHAEEDTTAIEIDVGRLLGVDELANSWAQRVDRLLDKYGLTTSTVGRVLATGVAIAFALLLNLLVARLITRLFRTFVRLKIRFHLNLKRMAIYKRIMTVFAQLVVLGMGLSAIALIWQGGEVGFYIGEQIVRFITAVGELTVLFALGVVLFEAATATTEHYFRKWATDGSPRVATLLPIARNATSGVLLVVFAITMISELGIDVMPLLAGAGVIGIAIGFGAQQIIKDLLTGFVIIFEDLIQVGDVVNLGGKGGAIEKITLRKVQLRDLSGTVITVPFGEITIVENLTKKFSYYLLDVAVAHRESPDEVIDVLQAIAQEMQADAEYAEDILEPIEILGVDQFTDSAIIIKARIKTRPIKQWRVGREFNRRMKYAFDERGIEIPFPHQTLYFGERKDGTAPAAHIKLSAPASAANDTGTAPTPARDL